MSVLIRKAAVLGAGTMGSRIAALLANAGLPVVLLDMAQEGGQPERHRGTQALEAVKKTEPAFVFEPSLAAASPWATSTTIWRCSAMTTG